MVAEDAFDPSAAFAYDWLDVSPYARLVRRSVANSQIGPIRAAVMEGGTCPWRKVLKRMVTSFADAAPTDGQLPVVILIQSRDPSDPGDRDVLAALRPKLDESDIRSFATIDLFDWRDRLAFFGGA